MARSSLEALVIGAGVVGLSCAARLLRSGLEVTILEAEPGFGRHASSRNSEVLHAGFYYEPGSEKAKHCARGRALLLARAEFRKIPNKLCGKLVVAQDEAECAQLEALLARGRANGVAGLSLLSQAELQQLEPELRGLAALSSSASGIIDSHALMQDLVNEIAALGGQIIYQTPVAAISYESGSCSIRIGGADPIEVETKYLVNAAGAQSLELAQDCDFGLSSEPRLRLVRGHYLDYRGPSPFRRLVYPVPEKDGLGIHATLDLAGRLRFGPDTLEVAGLDYDQPEGLATTFAQSIRRYWPGVEESRLGGGYSGIRTKFVTAPERAPDFAIFGPERHGQPGVVHLLGIESPGLTAALSLADEVAAQLGLDELV